MRIGIDVRPLQDRPLSGVGEYTEKIVGALLRLPTDDTFVLFTNSARHAVVLPEYWSPQKIIRRHVNVPNKVLNASFFLFHSPSVQRLLGHVDCFFVPNHHFLPRNGTIPMVLTVHDLSYTLYPALFSRGRRLWHTMVNPQRTINQATKIIAVSQSTAHDCTALFDVPQEKITTIHSGVTTYAVDATEAENVRRQYGLPQRFLFSLSTLEPRKNLLALLDSYALLRREGSYTGALVLAGVPGWSSKRLEHALARHPNRRDIYVLAYIPEREKNCLYRLADCFLYLSFYEGFGFPPLEALAQGTPVVTGHHSSLMETAGSGAVLVDVYNVRDVVAAVRHLLHDPKARAMLQQRGRQLVEAFTWEAAARATRDVFTDAVLSHAHRH